MDPNDVNESETNCSDRMNCTMNTSGICECACRKGAIYTNNEYLCIQADYNIIDINECESPCHPSATCTNASSGTYTCVCDAGYVGDGTNCRGMPF